MSFWERVKVGTIDECWPFRGLKDEDGYGKVWRAKDRSVQLAHRVAYFLTEGSNPTVVRHSCDNPPCCNPFHLLGGTVQDNIADRVARGRTAKGEANGMAKLTDQQVAEIRAKYVPRKYSQYRLAEEYGVSQGHISMIVNGAVRDEHDGMD